MTTPLIIKLNQIQTILNDYYIPIVYIIGTVSNILNIILFSRRKLRFNCCSWYFISLSISQFLLLNVNCLLRMIIWLNYNGFSTINSLCKIRSYFNILTLVLTRHFICLISIDRWLVTSTNVCLRNKSSLNNIRWIICGSLIFWMIFSLHAPINYQSRTVGCTPSSDSNYAIFASIYSIITSCTPFFIAIIFSILTLINIQNSTRQMNRIIPVVFTQTNVTIPIASIQTRQNKRLIKKRRDMDFVRLTFFQIIPYLLFNIISSFSPIILYLNSISIHRTTETTAQVTFIHFLGTYLLYLYVSITFIFYTLASNIFRKEFILLCQQSCSIIRHCRC